MSIIKKILILLIILTMCIPLINIIVYAHSVELETEGLISFPMFIMGGSGTVTIKDTIKDYKLYFQAIPVSDEIYLELQKNEPSQNEELKAIKGEYENLKKELDELKDKKDEYETKRIEYNNKISEYNNKVKELQEKQKELTPTYDEKDWKELTDNKFQIDLSQFEGNVAHAVWIKLVTSDNKTYYDEATYELSGTKKTTPNPTPSSEPDKEKLNTKLYVVKDQSETKYLENDQGYITKKIVDSNPDTGEVTIELKLSNKAKEVEKKSESTEIFLVVDNSPSMDFITKSGKTRKEIVLNSAKQLVESIFNNNSTTNLKIGLIDFHGSSLFETANIINATVRQQLTNDRNMMLNAINSQLERKTSSGTNIDAGLKRAEKSFSKDASNKIVVLLTDGIPNSDTQGNDTGDKVTTEEALTIQENTKQTILELKDKGIYTITMLTGIDESDGNTDKSGTVYENESTVEEELAAAERIFGNSQNPTADKYYLVNSSDIENIIKNDIFRDISKKINNSLQEIKIVDFFPGDITDNFDFTYVEKPNIGTISEGIDKETKTITWDIGNLKSDEEAVVKYKLKIKDMQNKNLLEKTISTNEKVVLTYKDIEDKDYTVTLTSSPQIKLSEVKEDENGNEEQSNSKDSTVAPNKTLPNTGLSIALIGGILLVIVGGLALLAKYHKLRDVK